MRRPLPLLSLALLLLAAFALAACGSGGGSGQDTGTLLKDTFGASSPVKSGRLSLTVDVRAPGISGVPSPLRVDVTGPFQSTSGKVPKFAFELKLATRDGRVGLGLISTGRQGWVRLGQRAYTLSPEVFGRLANTKGTSLQAKGTNPSGVSLRSLGVDPRRWLRDVKDEGTENLADAKVVHLSAGVDVPRLLTDVDQLLSRAGALGAGAAGLPKGISADRRAALAESVHDARVDIWTGEKDHQLRRISVKVKVDTATARNGTIALDLGIADLNRQQAIGPPANPRPLSELTTALTVLSQRRAQQAEGTSGGTATTTTPQATPKASGSGYDECISAAGSDLVKAQQCAALLN